MEEFEERAIATATYKAKIWQRHVDDTFTILGKDYVDGLLQHLNSQQPTIHFTMEIEKYNTIPFLDTPVSSDSNGLLTTSVYRNPTHTFPERTPCGLSYQFHQPLECHSPHLMAQGARMTDNKVRPYLQS